MCGIFAIYSQKYTNNNIKNLLFAMKKLQHRGKDGYGLSINDRNNILTTIKKRGEIYNNFKNCIDIQKKSKSCIGHLRYSTSGLSIQSGKIQYNEIQPLIGNINDTTFVEQMKKD